MMIMVLVVVVDTDDESMIMVLLMAIPKNLIYRSDNLTAWSALPLQVRFFIITHARGLVIDLSNKPLTKALGAIGVEQQG